MEADSRADSGIIDSNDQNEYVENDILDVTAITDGDSFMLNSSISSTFSQTQSAAIRSSRRRAKKGTAVVLNTDRLQKYMMKDGHNDSQVQSSTVTTILEEDNEINPVDEDGCSDENIQNPISPSKDEVRSNNHVYQPRLMAEEVKSVDGEMDPDAQIQRIKGEILANVQQLQRLQQQKQLQHSIEINETISSQSLLLNEDDPKLHLAAVRIQQSWHSHRELKKQKRSMYGVWTQHQSDLVFGLILGYRIRWLLRSPTISMKLKAMSDVRAVLLDLLINFSVEDKVNFADIKSPLVTLWNELHNPNLELHDILRKFPKLSQADVTLAKSLAKQFSAEKRQFLSLIYHDCKFRCDPSPGYYDFTSAVVRAFAAFKSAANTKCHTSSVVTGKTPRSNITLSPMRDLENSPKKLLTSETPPQLRHDESEVQKRNRDNSGVAMPKPFPIELEGDSAGADTITEMATEEGTGSRPRPLKDVLSSKSLGQRGANFRFPDSDPSDQIHTNPDSNIHLGSANDLRPYTSPGLAAERSIRPSRSIDHEQVFGVDERHRPFTAPSPSRTAISSRRKRTSPRGHIQLDILSAEKLMPAKKGAPVKDENGNPIPDRIPCLKVQLMMPTWGGGVGSSSSTPKTLSKSSVGSDTFEKMKKVQQEVRDFDVVTWNPVWDTNIILNLPCTKAIVQSIASSHTQFYQTGVLADGDLDVIRKQLLQWWSTGIIHIEVYDKERFNADIFMGQIELLLSSFMVLIKKPEDLEIKGNFHLEKSNPKDRVSGSVRLHAYLHVPEHEYLANLLRQSTNISIYGADAGGAQDEGITSSSTAVPASVLNVVKAKSKRGGMKKTSRNTSSRSNSPSFGNMNRAPSEKGTSANGNSEGCYDDEYYHQSQSSSTTSPEEIRNQKNFDQFQSQESGPILSSVSYSSQFMKELTSNHRDQQTRKKNESVAGNSDLSVDAEQKKSLLIGIKRRERGRGKDIGSSDRGDDGYTYVVQEPKDGEWNEQVSRSNVHKSVEVPGSVSLYDQSALSRPRTAYAAGSDGMKRRSFIADITKQLDGLSAVQDSADQMLGNFQRQLAEKRKVKGKNLDENLGCAKIDGNVHGDTVPSEQGHTHRPPPPPPPKSEREKDSVPDALRDAPLNCNDSDEQSDVEQSEDESTSSSYDSTGKEKRDNIYSSDELDDDIVDKSASSSKSDDEVDEEGICGTWVHVSDNSTEHGNRVSQDSAAAAEVGSEDENIIHDTSSYYSNNIMEDFSFTNTSTVNEEVTSSVSNAIHIEPVEDECNDASEDELIVIDPEKAKKISESHINSPSSLAGGHMKNLLRKSSNDSPTKVPPSNEGKRSPSKYPHRRRNSNQKKEEDSDYDRLSDSKYLKKVTLELSAYEL